MADNKRYRTFNLLLYPDNPQHQNAIERLMSSEFNAVGILHNMDVYEEDNDEHSAGELKKEHYHFVVKFRDNKTVSALAKNLDIEERFIDTTFSFKASAKYLLHMGCENKYQYDSDDLVGVLASDVVKLLDDTSIEVKAVKICDLLDDIDCYVSMGDFVRLIARYNLFSTYSRACYSFNQILKEHNSKYKESFNNADC